MMKRIETFLDPFPDRVGARDRKLLRDDDAREPRKAAVAFPQRRPPCDPEYLFEPWIELEEEFEARFEIGFRFDAAGHNCHLLLLQNFRQERPALY